MIGTSTGEQYDSEFDHTIANYQLTPSMHVPAAERPSTGPEKPTGEFKSTGGIDRSSFQDELSKNPALVHKMASMVKGEVGLGNLEHSQVQLETAFNRAQARGHSLGQALLSVAEDPHKGYYARDTYKRPASAAEVEAFQRDVLTPVLAGSNLSDRGYGPMTGNASAGVAARQFARGTPGYKLGGESYFNEEKGQHLTNLKGLPRLQGEAPITGNSKHSGTALNYAEASKEQTDAFNNLHIDRTKDVPLAASALHKDGQMYGIAVDKDAPKTDLGIPGFDPAHGVYIHEQAELSHMNNLIAGGQDPVEAYREAHDKVATPVETAFVRATAKQNGKDPDKFLDDYKQYWRDVSSNAASKEYPQRHPDAHTTTHKLDEAELGRSFGKEAIFRGLKGAGISKTDAQFQPINPMTPSYNNPGGHAGRTSETLLSGSWFKGAEGKWRQEIPDINSKMKPVSKMLSDFDRAGMSLKLGEILEHKELFKSYPELKKMEVKAVPEEYAQTMDGGYGNKTIWLRKDLSEDSMRSTLLHEIQHAIQEIEGFPGGASSKRMKPVVRKALDNLKEEGVPEYVIDKAASHFYEKVSGEVESRNVQKRKDFNYIERAFFSPEFTEDVPRDKQLNPPH